MPLRRMTVLAAALTALALILTASANAGQTVVSITFDDGTADQNAARSILAARGMNATFYVNTGQIGTSGFLSWSDLAALNADGNEIAGHTLDHVDLTAVSSTEARRQVCDDRTNLTMRGFIAPSFAYPYGEYDATVKTIVRECGYVSGRAAFGLRNITATNDSRPYAGRIPPPDPYAILTPCCINSTTTLSSLQNYITQAENNGGGWVPFVLHRVCDGCGDPSISPATLAALLDWLQPRASHDTVVRTVSQVLSGDAQAPTSSIACGGSACSSGSYSDSVTVTLAATDTGSGVSTIRYTTDGSQPTVFSPAYGGPFTVTSTTTVKYGAWDNAGNVEPTKSHLIQISPETDTTPPLSAIACNGSTCSSGWYAAPVNVELSATDDESGVAVIRYTLDGSEPTGSSTAFSGPFAISATRTVSFRAWDNAGNVEATKSQLLRIDTEAPSVVVISPANGSTVKGKVKVSADATDVASGVVQVSFRANGTLIGTKTSAPYFVNWQTNKLPPGQYTLTAVAADAAGNTRLSAPVVVNIN
jgi:peptidoglycan/xylan/chitin deacetylase (PgdA/CDA1 family)